MIKIRFIHSLLALIVVVLMFSVIPLASAAEEINVDAPIALLIEPESGFILYEKNAGEKAYPASLTKITTALIAIEAIEAGELSLDDVVTASDNFDFDMVPDGSSQNIKHGEQMTVRDLLYCIMVASANDACNIIAQEISGDVDSFVQRMNDRVAELGCSGTHYMNTHGLPDDDHYTTARDVSIIAREAFKHQLFDEIVSTCAYTTMETNMSPSRQLSSTNMLISHNLDGAYYYEYCRGGKTGFTSKAGHCLVSLSEKNQIQLLCVVMGAEEEQLTEELIGAKSFSQSRALFEWAYANFSMRTVVSTTDMIAEAPVLNGEDADYVVLHTDSDLVALLDNDLDLNSIERVIKLDTDANLTAPIERGQHVGTVEFLYDGKSLGSLNLVTLSAVAGKSSIIIEPSPSLEASGTAKHAKSGFTLLKILIVVIIVLIVGYLLLLINYTVKRKRYKKRKAEAAKRIRKE
ncbi:MAG: D-alanyl-D-alanine carboxypeptidase family protein [Oscillospiraceae bacterium]|jgi:D-alanyl-D-alanine carboxypeptidase (penicillin-binding protein 5/6)